MRNQLQQRVFEEILAQYTKKSEAVDALSRQLGVGRDAVYRRFRGDTLLTPDELSELSKTYHISLDAIINQNTDTVFFTYNPFERPVINFEDYLDRISNDLEQIAKIPGTKIKYASSEIPVFFHIFFPELIAFKLYVWGRTTWQFDYLENKPFEFDLVSYPVLRSAERLLELYLTIPTIELWSLNIIDNTLNQIEYITSSGGFAKPQDAFILCDKILLLVEHMKNMATKGIKFKPSVSLDESIGTFELFHNEMIYTNNTIIVDTKLGKAIYSSFGNPNFLKSSDQRICGFMEDWFTKIMAKSNAISTHAEKNRDWYFNRLKRKAELTRQRVDMSINGDF